MSVEDDQKRSSLFGGKKYRVTPSVTAPGDTKLSDATADELLVRSVFCHAKAAGRVGGRCVQQPDQSLATGTWYCRRGACRHADFRYACRT